MADLPPSRLCLPAWLPLLAPLPASADDLADFNAAVERAAAHNRVALGYLRTESVDLAAVELDRMKTAWGDLTGQLRRHAAGRVARQSAFIPRRWSMCRRASSRQSSCSIWAAPISRANSLQAIRLSLSNLRRESGIEILADCVLDYSAVMAVFVAYDDTPPDWSRPEMASELSARADAVEKVATRCDASRRRWRARAAGIPPPDRRHDRLARLRAEGDRRRATTICCIA